MSKIEPLLRPDIEASDAIRGYLYQFLYAVNALLDSGATGFVWVESFEDVAVAIGDVIHGVQVKDRKADFSLTQEKSCTMLERWFEDSQKGIDTRFLFVSTQTAGNLHDHSTSFREWVNGVQTEENIVRICESIKSYLLSRPRSGKTDFPNLTKALSDLATFRAFWTRITWRLGQEQWISALPATIARISSRDQISESEATQKLHAWIGALAVSATAPNHDERKWTLTRLYNATFRPEMQRIADKLAGVLNGAQQYFLSGISTEMLQKLDDIRALLLAQQSSRNTPKTRTQPSGSVDEPLEDLNFGDFACPVPELLFGREDDIKLLAFALKEANTVELGGIPGIGKTALAARYAETIAPRKKCLWIDCSDYYNSALMLNRISKFLLSVCEDSTLERSLCSATSNNARNMELAAVGLEKNECITIFDHFEKNDTGEPVSLIRMFNKFFKRAKVIIISTKHSPVDGLLNIPKRVLLSRLSEEAGIALLKATMARIEAPTVPVTLLRRAYNIVDGHPYFLSLLAGLSCQLAFSDLLDDLPGLVNEAHEYIQTRVLGLLTENSRKLLERLSILRIPFHISAAINIGSSAVAMQDFKILTRRFLVVRPNRHDEYYTIHGLIRSLSRHSLSPEETRETHSRAFMHYSLLQNKRFIDIRESVYHAIEAQMFNEGEKLAAHLLSFLIHVRRFEMVIEYAEELNSNIHSANWAKVHYSKGRAQRFLQRKREALDSYKIARTKTADKLLQETVDLEMASTMAELADAEENPDYGAAREVCNRLANSENLETKLFAQYTDALLASWSGFIDEAIPKMEQSLKFAKDHGLRRNEGLICYGLAMAEGEKLGNTEKAVQYLEQSKAIVEELRDKLSGQNTELEYRVLRALARFYEKQMKYEQSLDSAKGCVDIALELGISRRVASSLLNMARCLCHMENYSGAWEALENAKPLLGTTPVDAEDNLAFHHWAAVAKWHLGEFEQSVEHILSCHYISKKSSLYGPKFILMAPSQPSDGEEFKRHEFPGSHVFIFPQNIESFDLESWINSAVARRPELAEVQGTFKAVSDSTPQTPDLSQVRAKEPCLCGSGKQHKRCCGRKPV